MFRGTLCLLVIAVVLSPTAAAATATVTDGGDPGGATPANGTTTESTTPEVTTIASDGAFAGFTLGAAILAVVIAGTYRYLQD